MELEKKIVTCAEYIFIFGMIFGLLLLYNMSIFLMFSIISLVAREQ